MQRREFLKYLALVIASILGISLFERYYIEQKRIKQILELLNKVKKKLLEKSILTMENTGLEKKFFEDMGCSVYLYELNGKRFAYINNKKIPKEARLYSFLVDLGRFCELYSINNIENLSIITSSNDPMCMELSRNLDLLIDGKDLEYGISIWIPRLMISRPDGINKIQTSKDLRFIDFCVFALKELYRVFKHIDYVSNFGIIVKQSMIIGVLPFVRYDDKFYGLYNIEVGNNFIWEFGITYLIKEKKFIDFYRTNFEDYFGYVQTLDVLNYFNKASSILKNIIDINNIDLYKKQYYQLYNSFLKNYINKYEIFLKSLIKEILELTKEESKNPGTMFIFS